jgi:hypothetical protein
MEQPKTVWQWTAPWSDPATKMVMGRQKNEDGTGFKALEAGDAPRYCEYCDDMVTVYPHSHTKAEYGG